MSSGMKIGVVGAGKMAGALIKGWINVGAIEAQKVMASVPESDAILLEPLRTLGCKGTHSNKEVAEWADALLIGVKPGVMKYIANDLKQSKKTSGTGDFAPGHKLVVSMAAGLDTAKLEDWFGESYRVIRVMPNTAVEVQEGATVYSLGKTAKPEDCSVVEHLFSSVGKCWRVNEYQIDAVTGMSGSGPAYMYLVLEALMEEGVRQGLDPVLSQRLAAQTMQGAGKMACFKHPALLRAEVTSPGGSTAEGVRALERGNLRYTLMEAVAATTVRARALNTP